MRGHRRVPGDYYVFNSLFHRLAGYLGGGSIRAADRTGPLVKKKGREKVPLKILRYKFFTFFCISSLLTPGLCCAIRPHLHKTSSKIKLLSLSRRPQQSSKPGAGPCVTGEATHTPRLAVLLTAPPRPCPARTRLLRCWALRGT